MKKIIVIVLILILTITVVYYKDYLTHFKNYLIDFVFVEFKNYLIDSTPLKINIKYYDSPSYDPLVWNRLCKEGFITVLSIDNHKPGYSNKILFNSWKPYEKLEVFKKRGKLYIYYDEKNTTEKESFVISFPLTFSADKINTIIFINGERFNKVEFIHGTE